MVRIGLVRPSTASIDASLIAAGSFPACTAELKFLRRSLRTLSAAAQAQLDGLISGEETDDSDACAELERSGLIRRRGERLHAWPTSLELAMAAESVESVGS